MHAECMWLYNTTPCGLSDYQVCNARGFKMNRGAKDWMA